MCDTFQALAKRHGAHGRLPGGEEPVRRGALAGSCPVPHALPEAPGLPNHARRLDFRPMTAAKAVRLISEGEEMERSKQVAAASCSGVDRFIMLAKACVA